MHIRLGDLWGELALLKPIKKNSKPGSGTIYGAKKV